MRLAVKKVGTIFVRFQYFMSLQEDAKDVDVLSCVASKMGRSHLGAPCKFVQSKMIYGFLRYICFSDASTSFFCWIRA